jgi:hypothetical protein
MSIEIQKVKGEQDGVRRSLVTSTVAEALLQQSEIRPALLVENHGLTVEDCRANRKPQGRLLDCRETMRPVMAAARQDANACRLDMNRQAIAILLDLINPVVDPSAVSLSTKIRHGSMRSGIGSW